MKKILFSIKERKLSHLGCRQRSNITESAGILFSMLCNNCIVFQNSYRALPPHQHCTGFLFFCSSTHSCSLSNVCFSYTLCVRVHVCMCAHMPQCRGKHMEVRRQLFRFNSLLLPCGSQRLIGRFGGSPLYPLSHLGSCCCNSRH